MTAPWGAVCPRCDDPDPKRKGGTAYVCRSCSARFTSQVTTDNADGVPVRTTTWHR